MSALLSYRNLADAAALSLTGGTAMAGYPLTNVLRRELSSVFRVASIPLAEIIIDLGAAVRTDVVALLGINAASAATGNTAISYSSNGTSWTAISGATANDAAVPDLSRAIIVAHGIDTPYRYWKVRPSWSRLGGVTYYELARLWIGPALIVPEGCTSRWRSGFVDYGSLDASAGAQAYEDRRSRVRALKMAFNTLPTELAYGYAENATSSLNVPCFQDMQMAAGTTGEVIACARAESLLWMRHAAIYGHVASPYDIEHVAGPKYAVDLSIVEER